MCSDAKTPGQLDRPESGKWSGFADDFGLDKLPPFVMSTPCPLCHGETHIPRDKWDTMLSQARRVAREHTDKRDKAVEEYEKAKSMWDEMQDIKREQEAQWVEQGPFKFKKVD